LCAPQTRFAKVGFTGRRSSSSSSTSSSDDDNSVEALLEHYVEELDQFESDEGAFADRVQKAVTGTYFDCLYCAVVTRHMHIYIYICTCTQVLVVVHVQAIALAL
jgi:hypothetical protein